MLKSYEMYIADTLVVVNYFKFNDIIQITNIYVPEDKRNLYRTRNKELDEQIIKFIKKDVKEEETQQEKKDGIAG